MNTNNLADFQYILRVVTYVEVASKSADMAIADIDVFDLSFGSCVVNFEHYYLTENQKLISKSLQHSHFGIKMEFQRVVNKHLFHVDGIIELAWVFPVSFTYLRKIIMPHNLVNYFTWDKVMSLNSHFDMYYMTIIIGFRGISFSRIFHNYI